ncbi:hypothetical protein BASA50_004402 [Batrachochytrium salamandrivorans]|uniref:non-specific serine/threonine protein kinase n=1 Tax=Batrachochytrium salamandrivorans TaxID=1357716 RepID=A0ABQ8FFM6_9FUNG|nr:hypothetical protein BASA61_000112 [Batrachochytrium salamandrivorans]KAH6597485.1 hypothetical protein BASA50_004402 [Batrachochytrium salamandrivorans]
MFDPLLWVLHHFVTPHYAGQTTQGNTDDGDDANQASGSKDAASLLHRADSLRRTRELRENKASSSADPKSKNGRKDSVWKKSLSKSLPRQQSPPGPQQSTSHDPPQSNRILLPVRVGKSEAESYLQDQNPEQYDAFVESEAIYFKSTYSHEKILGEGKFGTVYLGTKRSNGMRVACKTIPTENVEEYALELSPPPRCHTPNPLSRHKKLAAAQCMSPRPSGLYVPHEVAIHMYLSRPGNENIYVPRAIDYITLQDGFILIMEYINEEWVSLLSYLMERGRLGVSEARHIIRKVIDGMINLKQQGVLQEDLHGMSQ